MREEQVHGRNRGTRDSGGIRRTPGGCLRAYRAAPAGGRSRAARGVPGLRLQPAAVTAAAARRPGHPDVPAAVPGDLPDRRFPRPRRHRGSGQCRSRPVTQRRSGSHAHHGQTAAPRHRCPRGRHGGGGHSGHPAQGQSAACAQGAGHAAARTRGECGRHAPAAAVPVAGGRRRGRLHPGRGRLAVRRPRAGPGTSADPARPGGPAHRARPLGALRRVPRVRACSRLPLWRRASRGDRRRPLPDLAVVLHQRHRLLPARPRRPADGPTSAACTST